MKDSDYPYVELESKGCQRLSLDRCTRCPICDKVFYIRDSEHWAYKMQNKSDLQRLFCSWGCLRKAEKIIKPDYFLIIN